MTDISAISIMMPLSPLLLHLHCAALLQSTVLPHLEIHSSLWQPISKVGIVANLTDSITAALLYGTVLMSNSTCDFTFILDYDCHYHLHAFSLKILYATQVR